MQEAAAAGDLPPLDLDAANVFSLSSHILQDYVCKHCANVTELRDLIQMVLHHPDFNADEVDHNMHKCLMRVVEDGNIKVLDLWEEGDGLQRVCKVYDIIVKTISHAERGNDVLVLE